MQYFNITIFRNRPIRPFHFVPAQIVPAQIVPVQIVLCPIRPCQFVLDQLVPAQLVLTISQKRRHTLTFIHEEFLSFREPSSNRLSGPPSTVMGYWGF
ncbi:Hypothetical protein FKW44_005754 [Caligus rogercresseyi]|uniref:Uncharacterized protein n=1 Tax=Caligus rogercresseyi TaxID=217165 RepID=A0A7T8QSA4_CALRO|nr:Hypothetical protein FKW44_005754 [Caligus rogercresseyi]